MEQAEVNILVIDDVKAVTTQLRELLRSFGFRKFKTACSVQEARAALQGEMFQLVLCDMHMTPVDGLEFLKFIRTTEPYSKLAFIMVTAEATRELVAEAIKAGVDDYIVKPLTLAHMNKVYGVLLKRQVL